MNRRMTHTFTNGFVLLIAALAPLAVKAQVHSKSGELIVMGPHNLPALAELGGESFFLHSDLSRPTNPALLAAVRQVRHRIVN
jgi:hypothetical protein